MKTSHDRCPKCDSTNLSYIRRGKVACLKCGHRFEIKEDQQPPGKSKTRQIVSSLSPEEETDELVQGVASGQYAVGAAHHGVREPAEQLEIDPLRVDRTPTIGAAPDHMLTDEMRLRQVGKTTRQWAAISTQKIQAEIERRENSFRGGSMMSQFR